MAMPDTDPGKPVATPFIAVPTPAYSVPHEEGGWTIQRLQVLHDASGICARCGMAGADTATRGWVEEHLVAAHTRCVVGLGPPPAGHVRAA
jgi:hypothetical protein